MAANYYLLTADVTGTPYGPGDIVLLDENDPIVLGGYATLWMGAIPGTPLPPAESLSDHLGDTQDAHDASAISITPIVGLTSVEVQAALSELAALVGVTVPLAEQIRDVIGAALVAGANVSIVPSDPGDTITIAVTGLTHTEISDFQESVEDLMGGKGWGGSGLTFTYNDGLGTFVLDVNVDGSTLEINSDTVRVKAGGITDNEVSGTAAIAQSKINGLVTDLAARRLNWNVRAVTTTATAALDDYLLADSTGGTFVITAPAPTTGRVWGVKWLAGAVAPTLSGTFNGGAPTLVVLQQGLEFISDGATWYRLVRPALAQLPDYPAVTDARYLGIAAAAGGGLTGTYPNPSVRRTLSAFTFAGAFVVAPGVFRLPILKASTLVSARVMCGTAPTGASAIFDVNKNGVTVFTTQSNRPTIAIAAQDSGVGATPDVTALAVGDYITVDQDQIGSTIAGSDAVLVIEVTTP